MAVWFAHKRKKRRGGGHIGYTMPSPYGSSQKSEDHEEGEEEEEEEVKNDNAEYDDDGNLIVCQVGFFSSPYDQLMNFSFLFSGFWKICLIF